MIMASKDDEIARLREEIGRNKDRIEDVQLEVGELRNLHFEHQ